MMSASAEVLDEGMDLRLVIASFLACWWWVALSVVFFTAALYGISHLLTPVYRATILLIPTKSDKDMDTGGSGLGGIGGVASLVGINLGGSDSQTEEALAVLKSREFTEKFIEDLHLMPILYEKLWDASAGKWKVDEKHQPTLSKAYRRFDKSIRMIVPEKKTSLINVNIDWTDRVLAASWANELVQRLNAVMRQRELSRADSAIGYLEKEFDTTTEVATREAIAHLIEAQVKQRMLATVTPEFAFRVVDRAPILDKDEVHFPNKFLMVVSGALVGLAVGVLLVMVFAYPKLVAQRRA
jgi:uncharacterized protein involved in exopolysaccharide biosynthesis